MTAENATVPGWSSFPPAYGFEFNNRELAVLTLIGAAAVYVLCTSKRREILRGLRSAAAAFLQWKVYVPIMSLFVWVGLWLILAKSLGLWHVSDLRATLQWCVTSGFILMINVNDIREGYLWKAARELVGVSAAIEFIANLEPLAYGWELALQFFGFLFVVAPIISNGKDRADWQRWSPNLLAGMFGLLMIHTFLVLASKGFHYDFATPAGAALLQLGLTLVALPFVTGFAVISGYESAFIRLGFANRSQRPPLAVRIGFISVTRWRLKYIRAATKGGTYNIARATTFRQARKATLDWRFARDEEDRAKTPAHGP